MKVCLDIRVSTKGGTSTFIDSYVRELDRIQHPHDIQFVFNEGATPLNGKHPRAAAVPYRNRILEFQWSQFGLPRILKQQGFDAYHSLKHVGPLYGSCRTIYRVPAVGQFYGTYPMQPLDHIYWNHVAGAAYKKADLLIAVSDYIRNGLIEHLKIPEDRVVTVHNGVDSRYRQIDPSTIPEEKWRSYGVVRPYILCVGNLVPVKNFATALKAYALLHEKDSELPQLVLAGGQKHRHCQELRTIIAEKNLEESVRLIGYQFGDDLLHLYNGAQMLVHPSLHEGFSFTILEAMACGLPIVASETTSIPEAAGDAAVYHKNPCDPEELASCIRRLLDQPELAATLSRNGLQRSPKFTWQKCVTESVALYDQLD